MQFKPKLRNVTVGFLNRDQCCSPPSVVVIEPSGQARIISAEQLSEQFEPADDESDVVWKNLLAEQASRSRPTPITGGVFQAEWPNDEGVARARVGIGG